MNSEQPKILIIGANPAWQKILQFDQLILGGVNRAISMQQFASGKGINCARAIATWHQATSHILHFVGGENGRNLTIRLQADDIAHTPIKTGGETRVCTTCLDNKGKMSELIEPSIAPTDVEIDNFIAKFNELAPNYDGIIICGTAPGSSSDILYTKLAEALKGYDIPILVDGGKFIQPLLESGRTSGVKINANELAELYPNLPIQEATTQLKEQYNLEFVGVTNGAKPAWLCGNSGVWQYTIPQLEECINPLGSGDCCNGVLFTEYLRGCEIEEAFKVALASASANCLTLFCGHFPVAEAAMIYSNIEIKKQG